jgi:AbrB family looped-hinge helix DNA binding protein
MKTKVSSQVQIVLPADIRKQDDIRTGQEFDVHRQGRGKYQLRRKAKPTGRGLVDWLLHSPEKGCFVSFESK